MWFVQLLAYSLALTIVLYALGALLIYKLRLTKTTKIVGFFIAWIITPMVELLMADELTVLSAQQKIFPAAAIGVIIAIFVISVAGRRASQQHYRATQSDLSRESRKENYSNNPLRQQVDSILQQKFGWTANEAYNALKGIIMLIAIIWVWIHHRNKSSDETNAPSPTSYLSSSAQKTQIKKCDFHLAHLTVPELREIKLIGQKTGYQIYNGNDFNIYDLKMGFKKNSIDLPIEILIKNNCVAGCSAYDITFHMFEEKKYSEAIGIPEDAISYTVLSAFRNECQQ